MNRILTFCTAIAATAFMAGCSNANKATGGANNEADLYKTWRMVEVDGLPVDTAGLMRPAELTFQQADSRVHGSAGCNMITGGFKLEAPNKISFTPMAATKMMCMGKMQYEDKFIGVTDKIKTWTVVDGVLTLGDTDGKTLVRLMAK
ncbi:META domain-containing protein [Chitinophaga sp. NPDC101104]|uniref:META domain-containing protein n=1 Tax=Chitinophaga sp. NPDC101104 TaxID=3390561 RepID=UPI003CFC5C76